MYQHIKLKSIVVNLITSMNDIISFHQLRAFAPSLPGIRKFVLATNIAETSVTISGIKYVIDSGFVKTRLIQPSTGIEMLKVISHADVHTHTYTDTHSHIHVHTHAHYHAKTSSHTYT